MSLSCAQKSAELHDDSSAVTEAHDPPAVSASPTVGVSMRQLDSEHLSKNGSHDIVVSFSDPTDLKTLSFRVTGAASAARLEPLLLEQEWGGGRIAWSPAISMDRATVRDRGSAVNADVLDFVWETTVTKAQREQHRNARVLNRLSGAQVLEDKANLAYLQRLMTAPTLESYVDTGRAEVERWAQERFQTKSGAPLLPPEGDESVMHSIRRDVGGVNGEDWWCVKAAGGNGGMDVWVVHEDNWRVIMERLYDKEDYVVQRYIARPMLWRGRKFHFRCYAAVSADMSAWLYRNAYILCASRPYTLRDQRASGGQGANNGLTDDLVHISNLAVNKHTRGHPGQVPCNIPSEYPLLWPPMVEMLSSLVTAATPFMEHQSSVGHFEFLGLDIIADETGGVWMIEVNRLPGLQSSKQNLEQENDMYNQMMMDLIRLLVLPPLTGCQPEPGLFEAASGPAPTANAPSAETWRNVMRFAAFKRGCKRTRTTSDQNDTGLR